MRSVLFSVIFLNLFPCLFAQEPIWHIGITQIVEHPSADQARKGVLDGLSFAGYKDNQNLKVHYDNAQGSLATAVQISKKYVGMDPKLDLIVAITTPSAQAMVAASKSANIPVIFAAVTDPLHAHLVKNLENPGENITGACDAPPIMEQLKLIKTILPMVKKIGVVYSSGETNSYKMVQDFTTMAGVLKIEVQEATVLKTSDVTSALQSLIGKVDCVYVPLDNTLLSAMEGFLRVAFANNIPVFTSDPNSVEQGALASLSRTQYDTGYLAGLMAAAVLGGEPVGNIPVAVPSKEYLVINNKTAQKLKIQIPASILERADSIIE